MRLHVLLVGFVALALVVSACGDDDDPATPPATELTTLAPITTTELPTTTAGDSITTTSGSATTVIDTNVLAAGSGCMPSGDDLPDGEWFGYVASAAASAVEFDLACWFTGDAAVAAAAEDGEESPPPNDYYVRNGNPLLRTVAVAEIPEVKWLPNVGDPATEESIAYADWLVQREERGLELQPGVWLIVENGEITALREQYVP
ncbi:MAG TPA: hypothetical protein VLG28_18705 [Acidimicrobiia bacterium]|jgi:hypothetical protein|nr:hypothetical protein [Acidimicrobiia bacterium]